MSSWGPTMQRAEVTNFSRMGSMAGLVTWGGWQESRRRCWAGQVLGRAALLLIVAWQQPGTKLILLKHGSRAPQVSLVLPPTCANSCLKNSYSSLGRMLRGGQGACPEK